MQKPFSFDLEGIRRENANTILLLEEAFTTLTEAKRDLRSETDYPAKVRVKIANARDEAAQQVANLSCELLHNIERSSGRHLRSESAFYNVYNDIKNRVEEHVNGTPQYKGWMWIVAGPNGAGKSTFVNSEYGAMAGNLPLLNPDIIAHNLNPSNVDAVANQAGRISLERMRKYLDTGQSFIVETTGAGKAYLKYAKEAKEKGWKVGFVYVANDDPQISVDRVKQRVDEGGHDVPDHVIVRRWEASRANLSKFISLSDFAAVIDNTDEREEHRFNLVASGENGKLINIQKSRLLTLMDILREAGQITSVAEVMANIEKSKNNGAVASR